MTNGLESSSSQPADWKVGDLIMGLGDSFLILSPTAYYIEQNGVVDNFLFTQLQDDDLFRKVLTTGLEYNFTSVEQAEQDFKEGMFIPYFAMVEQREKQLAKQTVFELLSQTTYRYLIEYNRIYAVIKRLPQTGWKLTAYNTQQEAKEEFEANKRFSATITAIDEKELSITIEFLSHQTELALGLNNLKFVALM